MLIKNMQGTEKLKAIVELLEEGKTIEEIATMGGYSNKKNVKAFLVSKGYEFENKTDKVIKVPEEQEEALQRQMTAKELNLNIVNDEAKDNLLDLLSNYKEFKAMLEWYKSCDGQVSAKEKIEVVEVVEQGIKIDLPSYEGQSYRASIRINPIIWKQFDEFAAKHPEFDKSALIAMSMKEYIDRHK